MTDGIPGDGELSSDVVSNRSLFKLQFRPANEKPLVDGHYLLFNQCDGYHVVEWRDYSGEILLDTGFYSFGESGPWPDDGYQAWAKLPDPGCELDKFKLPPRVDC